MSLWWSTRHTDNVETCLTQLWHHQQISLLAAIADCKLQVDIPLVLAILTTCGLAVGSTLWDCMYMICLPYKNTFNGYFAVESWLASFFPLVQNYAFSWDKPKVLISFLAPYHQLCLVCPSNSMYHYNCTMFDSISAIFAFSVSKP